MEIDMSAVLELWELIGSNVPNNRKDELATKFVSIFANEGAEKSDFNAIRGEDETLDVAVNNFFYEEEEDFGIEPEDDYNYDD